MGLGHKKGHVLGSSVTGSHRTLTESVNVVIKKFDKESWFGSVQSGNISRERGGKPSVTIKTYSDKIRQNTLTLVFRQSGSIQDVYVHVRDFEQNEHSVIADIRRIIREELQGYEIYDRHTERIMCEMREEGEGTIEGIALLEKWKNKKK